MALHLINGMTITPALLRDVTRLIVSGDEILCLEMDEKIYQLLQSDLIDKQIELNVGCFYLNSAPQSLVETAPFTSIDTNQFVALTAKHTKTLSWF